MSLGLTLPKAELHLHIEGTIEPELVFSLARRNGVELPFATVDDLRRRYVFDDLQSFLDLYYLSMAVLRTAQDFTDLTDAYLAKAREQGVRHAEIFFDPQAHVSRGVPLAEVMTGLTESLRTSRERFGISTRLIACFLRDLGPQEALSTWETLQPHLEHIDGIGLDSAEVGHPPQLFEPVFTRARDAGLHVVAHAGEEGPPEYVWQAIDVLGVERVDHGIRSVEDGALLKRLAGDRTPLTVCPLSNVRLRCVPELSRHPLPRLLDAGVLVTINSDDPSYFGGYVGENFTALQEALKLDDSVLRQFAADSFRASFLPEAERDALIAEIE
ncbi:adenosine deaminase [Saccharopolyspora antimicrobica]|uniref:Adenine deaminase n=1 Tax=Saccharopolyspora antimicrobica TaxID=455193 RepID=A0A1I4YU51_9PSEU|nr:adenosine deaminase [Saccharopolyspora antimicrobica]RKT82817.1 adenosine deaminase [Saccharopolyspora antimicrobica]SFN41568.1 adenosine deaminase [Saccharopolyspora antimicrobica]